GAEIGALETPEKVRGVDGAQVPRVRRDGFEEPCVVQREERLKRGAAVDAAVDPRVGADEDHPRLSWRSGSDGERPDGREARTARDEAPMRAAVLAAIDAAARVADVGGRAIEDVGLSGIDREKPDVDVLEAARRGMEGRAAVFALVHGVHRDPPRGRRARIEDDVGEPGALRAERRPAVRSGGGRGRGEKEEEREQETDSHDGPLLKSARYSPVPDRK